MAATRNLTTYRALLESLYVEQDLKMRQVMKHMEREHAIVAGYVKSNHASALSCL